LRAKSLIAFQNCFVFQSNIIGIGAEYSPDKKAPRHKVKVIRFDCLEETEADSRGPGYLFQGNASLFPFLL